MDINSVLKRSQRYPTLASETLKKKIFYPISNILNRCCFVVFASSPSHHRHHHHRRRLGDVMFTTIDLNMWTMTIIKPDFKSIADRCNWRYVHNVAHTLFSRISCFKIGPYCYVSVTLPLLLRVRNLVPIVTCS